MWITIWGLQADQSLILTEDAEADQSPSVLRVVAPSERVSNKKQNKNLSQAVKQMFAVCYSMCVKMDFMDCNYNPGRE